MIESFNCSPSRCEPIAALKMMVKPTAIASSWLDLCGYGVQRRSSPSRLNWLCRVRLNIERNRRYRPMASPLARIDAMNIWIATQMTPSCNPEDPMGIAFHAVTTGLEGGFCPRISLCKKCRQTLHLFLDKALRII